MHTDYAYEIKKQMERIGMRVEVDERNEKMGYKIRASQTQKIPYQLVVGDSEVQDNTVAVRKYGEKATVTINLSEYLETVSKEIENFSK